MLDNLANRCHSLEDDDDDHYLTDDGDGDDPMMGVTSGRRRRRRTETAKFRLFETAEICIEESYLMKRALRALGHLRCLVLWWAADDQVH